MDLVVFDDAGPMLDDPSSSLAANSEPAVITAPATGFLVVASITLPRTVTGCASAMRADSTTIATASFTG